MAPCSYAIEATCHAPDREGCYAEIFRVVKPGGLFACYEWATTDHYDPRNKEHQAIIENIQVGNGLPGVRSTRDVLKVGGEKMRFFFFHFVQKAARDAGWEVLEFSDLAEARPHYPIKWYYPLQV